jgi:uncharacterized RDD family membrane protein YckC
VAGPQPGGDRASATEPLELDTPTLATRASALLADALLIAVPYNLVVGNVLLTPLGDLGVLAPFLAFGILALAAAGYFVYFWTSRRATPGMRLMGIEVVGEDGAPLPGARALTRYLYVGLPIALATSFAGRIPLGADFGPSVTLGALGFAAALLVIASVAWLLLLGLTAARDARAQGIHDRAARSLVVWRNGDGRGR